MGGLAALGAGHVATGRANCELVEDPLLGDEGTAVGLAAVHLVFRLLLQPLHDIFLDDS